MSTQQTQPANSLSALVALIQQLPEGSQRLELEYAAGLKQRPAPSPFYVADYPSGKGGEAVARTIKVQGALRGVSVKTAKVIFEHMEQFADAIALAEKAPMSSKEAVKQAGGEVNIGSK